MHGVTDAYPQRDCQNGVLFLWSSFVFLKIGHDDELDRYHANWS